VTDAGVVGFGPDQALLRMEKEYDELRPRLTSTEVVEIRGARRRAGATPTSLAQARRRLAGEVVIGPLG
jgi:hypothetical protein